jgi:glycosyltransferase involved in cell wall biosynthesis
VDFLLRWYDVRASRLRRCASWCLCALCFPRRGSYDVFLTDGLQFPPLLMRRLGLLRRGQRVVALVADETFAFLRAGLFRARAARGLLWALHQYDAVICLARFESELVKSFVRGDRPVVLTARSGLQAERLPALLATRPVLDGRSIVFVGHGPDGRRGWYKGLDLLLEAVAAAGTDVRLLVVGRWDAEYRRRLLERVPAVASHVEFVGPVDDPTPHLAAAALYVHLARGEAFGVSVLEAMAAGLPALVSDWTGAREAVEQVDPRLVVSLDPGEAAERIRWYLGLPPADRRALSARSREVAAGYTEERARATFVEEFRRLLRHFDLPDLRPAEVLR